MQFKNLYQQLVQGSEIIRVLCAGVSQAEARWKPDAQTWSMLEVLCHLYDEEREDFRAHLHVVLNQPAETWQEIDPQGWVTARHYNEKDFATTLQNFLQERAQSLGWLNSLAAPDWEAEYSTRFGSMRAGDLLAAWAAHDNLHIRQLVELRQAHIIRQAQGYDVRYAGDW